MSPIARGRVVGGEAEHDFEGDVPVKSAIVAKHEFIEVGIDVLAAQAVIRASDQRFINANARWLHGRTMFAAIMPTTRGSCR